MKYLGYVIRTKRFYIAIVIHSLLLVIVLLCFQTVGTKVVEANETFKKCSADIIGIDPFYEESDSYAILDESVVISVSKEDGEALNLKAIQFLNGCKYTDASIINAKNICDGEYRVLKKNEIALPKSVAKENSLNVNNTVYVDGVECAIKYLYEDIYQITAVDFSVKQTVALVGVDTIEIDGQIEYYNFSPSDVMHRQMKSFSPVRKNLNGRTLLLIIGEVALCMLFATIISLFRTKDEILSLKRNKNSGDGRVVAECVQVEMGYGVPIIVFVGLTGIAVKINPIFLCMAIITAAACIVLNIIGILLRISR